MPTYGYARVSTEDQHAKQQEEALSKRGVDRIFTDVMSGAKKSRPALDELLATLRKGDAVVAWKTDRLGRSAIHLLQLFEYFKAQEIRLISLTEGESENSPFGKATRGMLAVWAELERDIIIERTKLGLQRVKQEGKRLGQKPAFTDDERQMVLNLWAQEKSVFLITEQMEPILQRRFEFEQAQRTPKERLTSRKPLHRATVYRLLHAEGRMSA